VVDAGGHKIGELEANYVDTGTDLPSFGRGKVGMPTRHRLVFMLFDQAAVGPGYLRVCYDKKQVKGCPVDRHRRRAARGDEEPIFKHAAWPTSLAAAVSGSWPAVRRPD
jgi:hypothetical protein